MTKGRMTGGGAPVSLRDRLIGLGLWQIYIGPGGTSVGPTPLGWAVAAGLAVAAYYGARKALKVLS